MERKNKIAAWVVSPIMFIIILIFGLHAIPVFMPEDDASETSPYMEEVDVFVPPSAEMGKTDTTDMLEAAIHINHYRLISSREGGQNYMTTSFIEGDW